MSLTILARTERLQHLLSASGEPCISDLQPPAEKAGENGFSLDRVVGLADREPVGIWGVVLWVVSYVGRGDAQGQGATVSGSIQRLEG